jgi:hypothetical protein
MKDAPPAYLTEEVAQIDARLTGLAHHRVRAAGYLTDARAPIGGGEGAAVSGLEHGQVNGQPVRMLAVLLLTGELGVRPIEVIDLQRNEAELVQRPW